MVNDNHHTVDNIEDRMISEVTNIYDGEDTRKQAKTMPGSSFDRLKKAISSGLKERYEA